MKHHGWQYQVSATYHQFYGNEVPKIITSLVHEKPVNATDAIMKIEHAGEPGRKARKL